MTTKSKKSLKVRACEHLENLFKANIYFGKSLSQVPENSIVLFPYRPNILYCGITGIIALKPPKNSVSKISVELIASMFDEIELHSYQYCVEKNLDFEKCYLGGKTRMSDLWEALKDLKRQDSFCNILQNSLLQEKISVLSERLQRFLDREREFFSREMGHLSSSHVEIISSGIEDLKDVVWCVNVELLKNIKKAQGLLRDDQPLVPTSISAFKGVNAVLNSIDRLEVRGRDSAGISLLFLLKESIFGQFETALQKEELSEEFQKRTHRQLLLNRDISVSKQEDSATIIFTYKVAAEVGRLGDNIDFIREQIQQDRLLHLLTSFPYTYHTVSAHTRWASMGAITEANCHPVDNRHKEKKGIIHVSLNGDIDNYLDLKAEIEKETELIHPDITTDTAIIPLLIEKYLQNGHPLDESIRLAVNNFKGSHAIIVQTDMAPGKIFLAQKGSGQTLFVGLSEEYYMPTSEVYGFVEETASFLKMDGEKQVEGVHGMTQGQIFELNQDSEGGLNGIRACYYDGTPIQLSQEDIKETEITSRDIDRQDFPHYLLKEIHESPVSVEKTLLNRWKIEKRKGYQQLVITLPESTLPKKLQKILRERQIRRICFMGQGTAGVAALACSHILNYYLGDTDFTIFAQKASELSGFMMEADDSEDCLSDTLIIGITQSGTTTDTNRAIDMAKARGAHTLAIVNRRDSDITFKVDGVLYTSSGRDVEMSVASTKAFYSQVVAGAILGLYLTRITGKRSDEFISNEIKQLLHLPDNMRNVLKQEKDIEKSAKALATQKTYWATVGSGPNKASADEIRIKLSELCYKTISSDFVEDKKHIDLSSEPLIILCAAGTKEEVLTDLIKDTAIFKAHKAAPVVIANEGEDRFDPYAQEVFHVPVVSQHFAPILNTLVGHLWGYHSALAINMGSHLLFTFREELRKDIDDYVKQGFDMYEIFLEKSFKEKIFHFYKTFRKKQKKQKLPSIMGLQAVSDLTLLLKYLSGRLPVGDFEVDFEVKGTPANMLKTFFSLLGESIDNMARPIDAIKHQAKTVTVGTSRIPQKIGGLIFDALQKHEITIDHLDSNNVLVLRNLQNIIADILGSTLYKIGGLSLLGETTEESLIEVVKKEGTSKVIESRAESDPHLIGIKRLIVQQGNVYIGRGRKDERSILVIPILSASPATPNLIEYLLLFNVALKENVSLDVKVKALGRKYQHIKDIVQEYLLLWQDFHLDLVEMEDLFGDSAEKIAVFIVECLKEKKAA